MNCHICLLGRGASAIRERRPELCRADGLVKPDAYMPQFSYKARRRSGEVVQGVLDVADRATALVQIEKLGLLPVLVDQARGGAATNRKSRETGSKPARADILPPALRELLREGRQFLEPRLALAVQ